MTCYINKRETERFKVSLEGAMKSESKKFVVQSGVYSSQIPQGGFGSNNESPGAYLHGTGSFPDRPSQITVLAGGCEISSSVNQANDVQSANVPREPISSSLNRGASTLPLRRSETMHFRLHGRSNVTVCVQVQGKSNFFWSSLAWKNSNFYIATSNRNFSLVGLANKGPDQKVEGTPVMGAPQVASPDTRYRSSNHFVTRTAYGNSQAAQQP